MRQFVRDFLVAHGSEVLSDSAHRLHVRLGEPLRELFGRDEMPMAFEAKHADESTELVTHGSFVMDAIHSFLQDQGWKTFVTLPAEKRLTSKEASALVEPVECELGKLTRKTRRAHEVHFHLKVSYLSDEKVEEVVSVRIDENGRASPGLSPGEVAKLDPTATPRGFLPKSQINERFRAAAAFVEREARKGAAEMQDAILERLCKSVTRIKGYYERQMAEALRRRSEEQAQEEVGALEVEMAMKLREQTDNHRLRVVVKLISLCVVERPVAEFTADLSRGEAEGQLLVTYDLTDGTLRLPFCGVCDAEMQRPALCDNGHVVCSECFSKCEQCGARLCTRCGITECGVCEQSVCTSCGERCASCTQFVCSSHLEPCCACGRQVCTSCADACTACGKTACHDHVRECPVCGQQVCHNCQTTCGSCGKVFCRTHSDVCAVCGQVTCSDCVQICDRCDKSVCEHHYSECSKCGATGCRTHFHECSVCEEPFCETHGELCTGCGKWTCGPHLTECGACGEKHCTVCFGEGRYCPGCLALILDGPDAQYARAEEVEAIAGRLPTDAELRNWRVYATALRRLFMADGSDGRTMIVTDEHYVTLRRRRIGYLPRRTRSDP